MTQKMCPSWTLGFLLPHFVHHGAVSHKKLDSRMKMKHSLRQLDELDSRICMRHIMKHDLCLNLCLIEIRKSNFFIMLPHFVLHVNPSVQLFLIVKTLRHHVRQQKSESPTQKLSVRLKKALMAPPCGSEVCLSTDSCFCWAHTGGQTLVKYNHVIQRLRVI